MNLYRLEYDRRSLQAFANEVNKYCLVIEFQENRYQILICKKNGELQATEKDVNMDPWKKLEERDFLLLGSEECIINKLHYFNIEFEPITYEEFLLISI